MLTYLQEMFLAFLRLENANHCEGKRKREREREREREAIVYSLCLTSLFAEVVHDDAAWALYPAVILNQKL